MEPDSNSAPGGVSRREVLRRTGIASGALVLGGGALAGGATATAGACDGCLAVCWIDVKPNSCPNSVNPNSSGVLPVTAGWPHFDVETVELLPVKGEYDAAFCDCQDFADPQYDIGPEAESELCELVASADRAASPTWSRVENVNGYGGDDTKFRFEVADLRLEPDDTFLVLRGKSSDGDCTFLGIDSVRVLSSGGGNGEQTCSGNGDPDGGENGDRSGSENGDPSGNRGGEENGEPGSEENDKPGSEENDEPGGNGGRNDDSGGNRGSNPHRSPPGHANARGGD